MSDRPENNPQGNATSGHTVIQGAVIKNNGLTSFIPPCFKWDVYDPVSGAKLTTVSEIDVTGIAPDDDARTALKSDITSGRLKVTGHVERTPPHHPSNQEGLRLVVERVE